MFTLVIIFNQSAYTPQLRIAHDLSYQGNQMQDNNELLQPVHDSLGSFMRAKISRGLNRPRTKFIKIAQNTRINRTTHHINRLVLVANIILIN